MTAPLTLDAAGTHLYPGARGTVRDGLPPEAVGAPLPCMVVFTDGAFALGTLAWRGDGWELAAGAYATARGTAIPAKRWRIGFDGAAFRVGARLPGG
ncbi:hypothetical protein [Azospirillum sp.]|uniref:hypothetical protein n=1 Tax=Azospirillum sp. TaxID=34012 RepID=UPI002D66EC7D|nr:hypothetical protein [Azospirillum sp.]HYD67314.1 hypothetical protein [Azospirillum sp.]